MSEQRPKNAALPELQWPDNDAVHCAPWRSEAGVPPPKKVVLADDRLSADAAYALASQGTALLWRGDFHNARQLLQALARRIDQKRPRVKNNPPSVDDFHRHRLAKAQRARTLGLLLLPFDAGHRLPLRRAPDVAAACEQATGPAETPYVASLRELLGMIGAFEWRRNGVFVPALDASIHPHYGVFAPVRGEYVNLVAQAPLPALTQAVDIGTGTGVLAAVLAQRGVASVVATDLAPRALACAVDNIERLGLAGQVSVQSADLFPAGRAPLIVCNPPWLPGRPSSALETAVYDPDSRMLRGFLASLSDHLTPGGEGWLILSDLAQRLGLRASAQLTDWIEAAGLSVIDRLDTRPGHRKSLDPSDPFHAARAGETTSLWRLGSG